jgi:dipeptidyl aminopeptidase/acylaminoacyl peptidase
VRVEATRLRKKLKEYYEGPGIQDPFRIVLPPGKYEVEFVAIEAAQPREPEPAAFPVAEPQPIRNRKPILWKVALSVLALVAVITGLLKFGRSGEPAVSILPFTSYPGVEDFPALSPDGRHVAFCWDEETQASRVYVQDVGQDTPQRLTQSSIREFRPAWSPDGTHIAFLREASPDSVEVRTIPFPSAGISETLLAKIRKVSGVTPGLSWSADGLWLATTEAEEGNLNIVLLSTKTGEERRFWTDGTPGRRLDPNFSPDGRYLAYVKSTDTAAGDLIVSRLPSGPEQQLTHDRAVINGITWQPDSSGLVIAS